MEVSPCLGFKHSNIWDIFLQISNNTLNVDSTDTHWQYLKEDKIVGAVDVLLALGPDNKIIKCFGRLRVGDLSLDGQRWDILFENKSHDFHLFHFAFENKNHVLCFFR